MRRLVAWLVMACALTACSADIPRGDSSGLLVITAGGTALVDGADDVPPTLDLQLAGPAGVSPANASVRLDGVELPLSSAGGRISTRVGAMAPGSAHSLLVDVPGRAQTRVDFHVVAATGAMAAAHLVGASPVVDITFERTPDRAAVEQAVGAAVRRWADDRHVTLSWTGTPPRSIRLPATVATARGSHLAGDLALDITVAPGTIGRATVPAVPRAAGVHVVGFTVGTPASRASAGAHAQDLSLLVPAGWHLSAAGELTGAPDQTAVAAAAAAHVGVWPLVQNDATDSAAISAVLNDPAAGGRLISQITDAGVRGGFPGIHLDLEGVPAADRDRLTELVHGLAGALHDRKIQLAVDVIPHRAGHLNRYSAAYDTTAIARDADMVALLAYDQHTAASDAGPVAGLDWQAEVLAGTLPGLDPAKTLLGVPLYARTWDRGSSSAAPYQDAVASALANQGAAVDYDFEGATPFIRWDAGTGTPSTTYFDDADSLARKFALARHRGMAGVAAWRLGFEDPGFWGLVQLSERG